MNCDCRLGLASCDGAHDAQVVLHGHGPPGELLWGACWGVVGLTDFYRVSNTSGLVKRLHSWNAWNLVVESHQDENDKWEVLNHFVEPIAFFCMLQPSSLADRITVAAETLLHQANQRVFPEQSDRLEQDMLPPGRTLRRSDRRKQLNRLGQSWTAYPAFRDALAAMDGEDYQKVTRNFRDLANHSFAPRLMIGDDTRAIRSIIPRHDLVEQPDGTFRRGSDA